METLTETEKRTLEAERRGGSVFCFLGLRLVDRMVEGDLSRLSGVFLVASEARELSLE